MTLLAVERIKLFSTRSPWWCTIISLVVTIGFAGLVAGTSGDKSPLTLAMTQLGYRFGLMVVMVLAALAVTTEYRFGTIKATFQAVPNRAATLVAKTTVVATLALVIGEVAAFGSVAVASILAPDADLAITTAEQWRQVAGVGPVFAIAAILSVAVGTLLRQTAGAVTLLMIWSLLVESLVVLVPQVGEDIQKWMPFTAAGYFLQGNATTAAEMPFSPWAALAYFAAIAIGLLVVAIVTAQRRDA